MGTNEPRAGYRFPVSALVLAAYWPVRHHYLLSCDDPEIVTDNPRVMADLTSPSVHHAIYTSLESNQAARHQAFSPTCVAESPDAFRANSRVWRVPSPV
jgi:hypothetical protein